jgi:hypothetical protein
MDRWYVTLLMEAILVCLFVLLVSRLRGANTIEKYTAHVNLTIDHTRFCFNTCILRNFNKFKRLSASPLKLDSRFLQMRDIIFVRLVVSISQVVALIVPPCCHFKRK